MMDRTDVRRAGAEVKPQDIPRDPWAGLGRFTAARIAIGRCGISVPIRPWLEFRLAHARARDAVHMPLQSERLLADLAARGLETIHLASSAETRDEYLTRPDKGRRLSIASRERLRSFGEAHPDSAPDICVVISDGLSARAVHENAAECAELFLRQAWDAGLTASPVVVVEAGRVAIGDEIAAMLDARLVVILIGERPGLTSPNSLGAYMTYAPYPGIHDDMRNCISNIRDGGMDRKEAMRKLAYLVENALARHLSGVQLKDDMPATYLPFRAGREALQAGTTVEAHAGPEHPV